MKSESDYQAVKKSVRNWNIVFLALSIIYAGALAYFYFYFKDENTKELIKDSIWYWATALVGTSVTSIFYLCIFRGDPKASDIYPEFAFLASTRVVATILADVWMIRSALIGLLFYVSYRSCRGESDPDQKY